VCHNEDLCPFLMVRYSGKHQSRWPWNSKAHGQLWTRYDPNSSSFCNLVFSIYFFLYYFPRFMSQDWISLSFEVVRTEEHADKTAGRAGFRLKASGLKRLWPFCAISSQKMQKLLNRGLVFHRQDASVSEAVRSLTCLMKICDQKSLIPRWRLDPLAADFR